MKIWIRFILILIVCIILVGGVYVWRFGWPKWENKEEKMLQNIVGYISSNIPEENSEEYTTSVILEGTTITFTKKYINEEIAAQSVIFQFEDGIISTVSTANNADSAFFDETIQLVFEAVAVYNGYNADNARYSLIHDILSTKNFDDDGYHLTTTNNVTRFMVRTDKKLNLAQKQEVYIKPVDIENVKDILLSKLQYKLIEKPGIVLEKNVSYARNLTYVIYEKEKLTDRAYNSLFTLLDVVIDNPPTIDYVKANYPVITHAGTLTLDGISISLNEGLGEGNVHYYDMPEDYEYMLIKINIDKHIN